MDSIEEGLDNLPQDSVASSSSSSNVKIRKTDAERMREVRSKESKEDKKIRQKKGNKFKIQIIKSIILFKMPNCTKGNGLNSKKFLRQFFMPPSMIRKNVLSICCRNIRT